MKYFIKGLIWRVSLALLVTWIYVYVLKLPLA